MNHSAPGLPSDMQRESGKARPEIGPADRLDPANRNEPAAGNASQLAGTSASGLGARLSDIARRADDGAILRWSFRLILAAAMVVLLLDLREIRSLENAAPDFGTAPGESVPVLPPALTEGTPPAPPFDIRSEPEALKQPMRFALLPGGILTAEGAIDVGAANRFAAEIEARGEYVRVVDLNSPGGSVDDALAISTLVREREFDTRVSGGGLCASSCPIILSGGVSRAAADDAVVGVHQVYGAGDAMPSAAHAMAAAQTTTARVARHLAAMDIEPGLWLHALETPPDRLYYLTQDEMRGLNVTTRAFDAGDATTLEVGQFE
jgi:hypothetical protein